MGYFYKLSWPANPDTTTVAVTGTFDDWSLSDAGHLKKSSDSSVYETVVRVDEKQKLVFKFVVNGAHWTTYDSYKIEYDEHGNQNNFINADELIEEEERLEGVQNNYDSDADTPASEQLTDVVIAESVFAPVDPDIAPSMVDKNTISTEYQESTPPSSTNDELYESAEANESEILQEETAKVLGGTAAPSVFVVKKASPLVAASMVSSTQTHKAHEARSPAGVIDDTFLDQEGDLDNMSLAESSFTNLSYITSSSKSVSQDIKEARGLDAQWGITAMSSGDSKDSLAETEEESQSSSQYNTVENSEVSSRNSDVDDSVGDLEDSQMVDASSSPQTPRVRPEASDGGVFAKIRGLFRY